MTLARFGFTEIEYFLPTYDMGVPDWGRHYELMKPYYKRLDYLDPDGKLSGVKLLVDQWFKNGYVPAELENIIHIYSIFDF